MATKQPDDRSHFILPDLGEGVHEAELIKWRVKPGETVEEHQTLAEMETDKALVEVPSPWAGVVSELCGEEGQIINVGDVLVRYDAGGGKSSAAKPAKAAEAAVEAEPDAPESNEDAGTVVGSVGGALSIPGRFAARRDDAANGATPTGRALATPAVRRIARDLGVDIHRVPGTGRGGRVTASDVQAFVDDGGATTAPSRTAPAAGGGFSSRDAAPVAIAPDGVAERIPFRGVRRKIAQALHRSMSTAVHFTVVDEVDVTELDRKRKEYAAVLGHKLSFLPFIMSAVCHGLRKHPALNAIVDDDREEILLKNVINLGCAVDTEHGLMVPVIPTADTLSLTGLNDSVKTLADACRNRTIDREQLTGGTFTISNVGSYGGMFATPVINYPEVAILAAGRVFESVMTRDGMFYAGKVLPLSLSCDHRVVDGAEGTRFLNTVRSLLENPGELVR